MRTDLIILAVLTILAFAGVAYFTDDQNLTNLSPNDPLSPPEILGDAPPTYFAELDANNVVLRVIVADQAFINSGRVGNPSRWKQTYMETDPSRNPFKNYAGIGYTFDEHRNAFVAPRDVSRKATFDETKARWIYESKVTQ